MEKREQSKEKNKETKKETKTKYNAINRLNVIWTVDLKDKNVLRILSEMGIELYRQEGEKKNDKRARAICANEQIEWASNIHYWLDKLSRRNNANLMNLGVISKILQNEVIEYNVVEGQLKREETKEIEVESDGLLKYSRVENEKVMKLTKDEIECVKKTIMTGLNREGASFRMIEIKIPGLMRLTPKYVNQLRGRINVEQVSVTDIIHSENYYARMVFEKPLLVYNAVSMNVIRKFKADDRHIYIMSEDVNQNDMKERGLRVYTPLASKLVFTKKDRRLSIYVGLPPQMFVNRIDDKYMNFINEINDASMIPSMQSTFGMGMAKLTRVMAATPSTPRLTARATLEKLKMEINSDRKVVTCVVIGNKGSGKTTMTKRMVELLDGMKGRKCFRIDSDAPGRWMYDRSNKVECKNFEEILSYNSEMCVSLYEKIVDDMIMKENLDLDKFNRLTSRKREEIMNVIKGLIDDKLISGREEVNEKAFYDMVHEMVPTNSILILEAHRITQDAVLGGTDISILYEGTQDPVCTFMKRGTMLRDLILREIYQKDYSFSHVLINAMEMAIVLTE
nr:VP7 protein [Hubei lepidoptera virus 3]